MKKILALILVNLLLIIGAGGTVAAVALTDNLLEQTLQTQAAENKIYLVPGVYKSGDNKKLNTITASGVKKLDDAECEAIYTENAYVCTKAVGEKLPTPRSTRKDKNGEPYRFNGWWAIVEGTVTYYQTVPSMTEQTFLYADWRADLSQRKDPVIPDIGEKVEPNHYIIVKHADGTEDKVTLIRGYTNLSNAETLGYARPAEIKIEGLELKPGDSFIVYTTGLNKGSDKAEIAPVGGSNQMWNIDLEASGEKINDTKTYLSANTSAYYTVDPVITYIYETAGTYSLYIKFFSGGSKMAVYMEPLGLV